MCYSAAASPYMRRPWSRNLNELEPILRYPGRGWLRLHFEDENRNTTCRKPSHRIECPDSCHSRLLDLASTSRPPCRLASHAMAFSINGEHSALSCLTPKLCGRFPRWVGFTHPSLSVALRRPHDGRHPRVGRTRIQGPPNRHSPR